MSFVCKHLLCPRKAVHGPCERLGPKGLEMLASKETPIGAPFPVAESGRVPGRQQRVPGRDHFPCGPVFSGHFYESTSRERGGRPLFLDPEMQGGAGMAPTGFTVSGRAPSTRVLDSSRPAECGGLQGTPDPATLWLCFLVGQKVPGTNEPRSPSLL